jgi:hypothetical protein
MKLDFETYEPPKPARFWCKRCDDKVVDSQKPETGKFFTIDGHTYNSKTNNYDGNYDVLMFAVCNSCINS